MLLRVCRGIQVLCREFPGLVHWNDPTYKSYIDTKHGFLWFQKSDKRFRDLVRPKVENARIHFHHDRSEKSFGEICPGFGEWARVRGVKTSKAE